MYTKLNAMFGSLVTLAIRNLQNNKIYSVINIAGLAAGMTVSFLIGLWINDELNFDHYFPNHSRLGVAMITQAAPGTRIYSGDAVPPILGYTCSQYHDLFSRTALTHNAGNDMLISATLPTNAGGKNTDEKVVTGNGLWAEPQFPSMFGFHILHGSIDALTDPSTVLISQSIAAALYGDANPLGKIIKIDNTAAFRVGAVFADLPRNSFFDRPGLLLSWYNQLDSNFLKKKSDWRHHYYSNFFVELAPGVTEKEATERIRLLPTPHTDIDHETAFIYPVDRVHLYGDFKNGKPAGGLISFVWLFGIIGGFVLLLACINFMNLSTARSEKRAKEVGIRKTIGSRAWQLIVQFLSESIVFAFVALGFALLLTAIFLPAFNHIAGKEIGLPWSKPFFWLAITGFALLTGLLAGIYPAFYLSSFNPVRAITRRSSVPRQILVVFQLFVSLILIVGTLIIYRQILYMKDRPVGYSREGLLTVAFNSSDLEHHYNALRTELLQKGLATDVATSDQTTTAFSNGTFLKWSGMPAAANAIMFHNVNVSPDYGRTIRWTIVKGRDFSHDFSTDSGAMILNEAAARIIGMKDPIGQIIRMSDRPFTVIGIARDMVTNNPSDSVQPAIFLGGMHTFVINIRLNPNLPIKRDLAAMKAVFSKYNPSSPFLYHFADDDYEAKFKSADQVGNLAAIFAALAIFISCLGLLGLAAFIAEQRTKEIGVRKVLGASVLNIWSLLSKNFLKLSILALLFAIPPAWIAMHAWVRSYSYHAPLSWWNFALPSAGLLLITLATVSFQSLKAAFMNPVTSLRTE